MKNSLLTLALLACASSMLAANITENWTTVLPEEGSEETPWFPTQRPTEVTQYTSPATRIVYSQIGCYIGSYSGDSYLMINGKKQQDPKAFIEFSLPIDCAEIWLTTTSGCSTNSANKVNVYADDVIIESAFAVNAQSKTFKVAIPAAYRDAGTVYKIETNTTSYNQQFASFTYVEPSVDPSISLATKSLSFATPLNGTQTATIKGVAENISGNITLSSSSADITFASTSVTADELAEGVEVTFTGATSGNGSATITVAAGSVTANVDVTYMVVANQGTEDNPLTVKDVIEMKSANAGPFYVTGKILGKTAANAKDGVLSFEATAKTTNIILTDDEDNMIAVQLPSGETRAALNIVDNPNMIGKTVVLKGTLENYFGVPGVKNAEYTAPSAIGAINAETAAPATYFNLQGQKVANPNGGVFIKVQNGKSSKVAL